MINSVQLKNFGPLDDINWQNLGPINLVIGNNGCGKSFLLKALYSAVRTLENYKRGDNPASLEQILIDKLCWTFELDPRNFRDFLISEEREFGDELLLSIKLYEKVFSYTFSHSMKLPTIFSKPIINETPVRTENSVFIPAKEILAFYALILKSRQIDKRFGFDDTYLDLALALQDKPSIRPIEFNSNSAVPVNSLTNNNSTHLNHSRFLLEQIVGGTIELKEGDGRWYFRKGSTTFPISVTAEGIKKLAVFDILLGNGYLTKNSIVFIDEPESNLHPKAITAFLDIIALLAQQGIQFFIASHSYFVIKKLFLIAQEQKLSIPVLSKDSDIWQQSDLLVDMPSNGIINESIRLYKEEVSLAFK
jgi:AAA15 family ATPase/GTPase